MNEVNPNKLGAAQYDRHPDERALRASRGTLTVATQGSAMTQFETDSIVAGISRWAACESPSADAAAVNRMIDIVAADCADAPVAVERLAGWQGCADTLVLRAGPRNGQPHALVLSHLDTVHPLGTLADRLPVRVEGDRLYGPGVMDMKGGAYMGLVALKEATRADALTRPTVHLFTPDEEIGSPGSRPLIEEHGRGAAHVLVTEPARPGGRVVTARRGSGRYEVRLRGIPAHSGTAHEAGRSAIREAAHQILAVEALNDAERGINATVGLMKGGSAVNTVPEHASFMLDVRMSDPADAERLDRCIRALKAREPEVKITVDGRITRPPYAKSKAIADLHARVQAIGAELGLDLADIALGGGGSDGNFTASMGIPTLDGLGIEGFGAHTLHEYALIPSIPVRTALLYHLITRL